MGKLLRVLVVFLFLLGFGALFLGIQLFQKRETLKGHVQDLAQKVVELSANIEAEQADDLTQTENPKMNAQVALPQLLKYKLAPQETADTNKPAIMEDTLKLLIGKSAVQLSRLNDTRSALSQKIQELEIATNKIAALEADIVKLADEKKQLQENVATVQKDVTERTAKIAELEAKLEEAVTKAADLQEKVAKMQETLADRDEEIKTLNAIIEKMKPKGGGPNTIGAVGDIQPGAKGSLVLVNKNWNFVVIGMNDSAALYAGLELTVHRGDKWVGKVKISDVNDQYRLAIGDVVMNMKQDDPEVGDHVFY
jgi:hypothetical protein